MPPKNSKGGFDFQLLFALASEKMNSMKSSTLTIFSAAVFGLSLLCFAETDKLDSAAEIKERSEAVRQQMLLISRQLGITCAACHNPENFKSSEKPLFPIAKKHIELTKLLIDHGMNGQNGETKADCYMCHRGKQIPDYKEKIDPMLRNEFKPKEVKP